MNSVDEIKSILLQNREELRRKYKVKEIGIFGSYVRGEQQSLSDIDILVEFGEPIGFFKFMDLEDFLRRLLGVKVDLVTKKALKPNIGKHILREVEYLQ